MDITLTDGTAIKVADQGKLGQGENEKIHCSLECPLLKEHMWEPATPNIGRCIPAPFCAMTNHYFGWKEALRFDEKGRLLPHRGYFETVRTSECCSKDPDPEVLSRRNEFAQKRGLGDQHPSVSDHTLVAR